MYNKIKTMWGIFKNDNEWNEKNVVGFIAFLVMQHNYNKETKKELSEVQKSIRDLKGKTYGEDCQ